MSSLLPKPGTNWPTRRPTPLSAGGWATTSYIISYAVGALLFIPLARLLEPEDFGAFTTATLVSGCLVLVLERSLMRALVRAPGAPGQVAQATFWLSLGLGIGGAGLCALAGPLIALLYNDSHLIWLLILLAPGVLATTLGSVPHALLSRELDFRRKLIPETVSVFVAAGLALGAGLLHLGVYSLIIYNVTRAILNTGLAWRIVSWRPTLGRPDPAIVRELIGFGLPASGGELALFARFNLDYAIVRLWLGSSGLGVYYLAWETAERPAKLINAFFDNVGYATFARLKDHEAQLSRVYLSATRLLAVVTLPMFLSALVLRQELVSVVFGSKWQAMVEPLLPLFILQALWVIFYPSASLVLALGHSRIYAAVNGIGLVLTVGGVLIGINYGVLGVATAMLMSSGLISLTWGGLACWLLRPSATLVWAAARLPLWLTLATAGLTLALEVLTSYLGLAALLRLAAGLLGGLIGLVLVGWRSWPALRKDFAYLREGLPEENYPVADPELKVESRLA